MNTDRRLTSHTFTAHTQSLLDLVLPRQCGGCSRSGTMWCERCADTLDADPIEVIPRVETGAPCWALGRYQGPHKNAVIMAKERGRRDLAVPLGGALASAVTTLRLWGEIDPSQLNPLVLVPAPTRRRIARSRGGDPVRRAAIEAASALHPESTWVAPLLRMAVGVRDSVGLTVGDRQDNLHGRIRVVRWLRDVSAAPRGRATLPGVILVDDVLTTGATAAESVRTLKEFGIDVVCVLVVAAV